MSGTNRILSLITFVLLTGFILLALPEKGYSGLPLGCCTTPPNGTTECIGCDGLDCSININLCDEPNEFQGLAACVADGGNAECVAASGLVGCCIDGNGNCLEEAVDIEECSLGNEGLAWFPETECSEVPQCGQNSVSNIPTLSPWAVAAVAVALAIIGYIFIIRNRKSVG